MLINSNCKLVMIGDSITDCQRVRPSGEGYCSDPFGPLGNGYVNIVNSLIQTTFPDSRIRIVNKGIGGDTTRDLLNRWDNDILAINPDWISIMIGINDVWKQFSESLIFEKHISVDEYKTNLEELIQRSPPNTKGLILLAPYIIEPNKRDPMRIKMDEFGGIVKTIATKYNAIFVDTQEAFDKFLQLNHSYAISQDRIHPNTTGHTIIAKAFLNAIKFAW